MSHVALAHATLVQDLREIPVDGVVDGARAASLGQEHSTVGDGRSGGGRHGDVTGTGRDSGQFYGMIVA